MRDSNHKTTVSVASEVSEALVIITIYRPPLPELRFFIYHTHSTVSEAIDKSQYPPL